MAIIRVNKTSDYTVMANFHFREKAMSLKAKGLLSLMLSLPEDWDYSVEGLATITSDGVRAVRSGLQELERFGYLRRAQKSDEKGKFAGYVYDVFEVPQVAADPSEQNPSAQNPSAQNVRTDAYRNNSYKSSTYESSTEEQNACACAREDHPVPEEQMDEDIAEEVIAYLNEKASVSFRSSSRSTRRHIAARISEGYGLNDFKDVIDVKCQEWSGTKLAPYLRPETLFGTKFESYLQQARSFQRARGGKTYDLDEFFAAAVERTKRKRGAEK